MKSLLLLPFILFGFTANATNYYLSATGNDSNNGTSTSTPWQTITKLNSFFKSLVSGDHVLFNRGDVFYGTILPTKGFTSGNPLVFSAYGTGVNPVITGFTLVSAWTNIGRNIWESTSAVSTLNDLNLVVINGVNTAMGRYPNSGYLTYQGHVSNTQIISTSLNAANTNWTGADVVMKTYDFNISRNLITAMSGDTLTYTHTLPDYGNNGYGFFIENDSMTLDTAGEWYYNPSTKKLRIYSSTSPTNVQASTLDTLVFITQKANFTFDGIDFTGSNRAAFYLGGAGGVTVQNCNINYHVYGVWGEQTFGTPSPGVNFNNNTFNHINSMGIILGNDYVNPYIGYNTFKNCGVLPGMFKVTNGTSQALGAYGSIYNFANTGLVVEYNLIDSTGYAGIWFNGANTRVNNNEVMHYGLNLMDVGGIYTYYGTTWPPTTGGKIYNNIVHDGIGDKSGTTNVGTPSVFGIYLDDNTRNMQVYNNSCFNLPYSGFFGNNEDSCNFYNNTFYNNGLDQMVFSSTFSNGSTRVFANDTLKNNILFCKASTQLAASFWSINTNVTSFWNVADSNYYVRPIADDSVIQVLLNHYAISTNYTLGEWHNYSGFDAHSYNSPNKITDIKDLRYEYNATGSKKIISLPYNYIDVKGTTYNGTITLAPYSSIVLIRNGAIR
jgi:hypothetical protein